MFLDGYGLELLRGAVITLQVAFTSAAIGIVLGILGAAAKLSHRAWLSRPVDLLTMLLRGVPEFLILLIVYFGLSQVFAAVDIEIDISPFTGGVTALSVVFGSYASEVFRGAFLAVPHGQLEAARAFGMRPIHTFWRIHLPQAWRFALPSLNNMWQNTLKDTALVSLLGLEELLHRANAAAQVTKHPFNFMVAAGAIYFLYLALSNPVFAYLERRARRGLARA